MTGAIIKAKPLVAIVLLSLLMMMTIPHPRQPLHQPVAPTTDLAIDLALVSIKVSVCHKCVINVVSAKTSKPSNGLIAECTLHHW